MLSYDDLISLLRHLGLQREWSATGNPDVCRDRKKVREERTMYLRV